VLAPAEMCFDDFLKDHADYLGRMCHVAVTEGNHVVGAVRVNMALPHESTKQHPGMTMGDIASRAYTIVHEDDIVFDVIRRIWRKNATMALVVRGHGVPRPTDLAGVITKEHVADSVAASIKVYPS